MTTLLISHPACLAHDMGEGHPEQPDRLRAVERALESENFQMLARDIAPRAEISAIARVHPLDYIEALRAATPTQGHTVIDQDTSMSPGTFEAALRSAGGAVSAVDEVMTRKVRNAFVATRPPGHHAEVATPMGFCFFNNVAVAARHAHSTYGAERVAIMDFDVHHGNGTQHIFWDDPSVLYASTHEMPHYPGTGSIGERGAHDQIVNAPLRAGDAGDTFREAIEVAILPRIIRVCPRLDHYLCRFRRPSSGSARQHQSGRGGFRLGHPKAYGNRTEAVRRPRHLGARGRVRSRRPRAFGRRSRDDTDGRLKLPARAYPSIGSTEAISMPKPDRPT